MSAVETAGLSDVVNQLKETARSDDREHVEALLVLRQAYAEIYFETHCRTDIRPSDGMDRRMDKERRGAFRDREGSS